MYKPLHGVGTHRPEEMLGYELFYHTLGGTYKWLLWPGRWPPAHHCFCCFFCLNLFSLKLIFSLFSLCNATPQNYENIRKWYPKVRIHKGSWRLLGATSTAWFCWSGVGQRAVCEPAPAGLEISFENGCCEHLEHPSEGL